MNDASYHSYKFVAVFVWIIRSIIDYEWFIIYDASYYSYEYCIIRSIFLETCCVPWYHRFWMMLHIIHTNTATNMTHMSTSYPIYTNKAYQTHTNNLNNMNDATNVTHMNVAACMGWLRLVGSIKLCVSFAEYRIFYRALLQYVSHSSHHSYMAIILTGGSCKL